jgi:glycosyltransferase involved in cell wall biosynthesis
MSWRDEICLVLEGTYPFVPGGVSSWVHTLVGAMPERAFRIEHIGPHPGAYRQASFQMPASVVGLAQIFCMAAPGGVKPVPPVRPRGASDGPPSRVIRAVGRLHLGDTVDDALVADLASADLSVSEFLHGAEAFDLIRDHLYPRLAPDAPFTEFFWHMRAMHVPLLRVLAAEVPLAGLYHSASCGYAGLLAAVAGLRHQRPVIITEHGIYARERELELARTRWIHDPGEEDRAGTPYQLSPLRRIWAHYFTMLSRIAYHQAARLITLTDVNRARQLSDGASADKIEIIPNGVEPEELAFAAGSARRRERPRPLRVAFVGRVVPIKDVLTLIRAVHLAHQSVDVECWLVGPEDEDPEYAARCRELAALLGLGEVVRFLGRRDVREVYPEIDALVLTSVSEGQPLVILEAFAAGLPVIASDVGACRELVLGGPGEDAALGAAGIVTRVASPEETADAIALLARDHELRRAMGERALRRVHQRYRLESVLARYRAIYESMVLS